MDLVVVGDRRSMGYTERLSILYRLWDKEVDANFVPLTREELMKALERAWCSATPQGTE